MTNKNEFSNKIIEFKSEILQDIKNATFRFNYKVIEYLQEFIEEIYNGLKSLESEDIFELMEK